MKKYLLAMFLLFVSFGAAFGQAISVNGGSIQGTITDASGAALPKAAIVISNPDTGYTKSLQTDSAGFYSVGPLNPGPYVVRVTYPNFETLDVKTVVHTGTVTPGTFKLTLGKSTETIEVSAGAIQVNTDQIAVSDVLTGDQIANLPINGRNFLDVAQIEPGVILQQGSSFDPTKAGYSAISVSGVSGRTTRILLDGQDITDEFVGTTIFNVSQGAIAEFQLNRSTQDVSGDVTSTGQVLVSTRTGTNSVHGQAFYNFQDYRALFANGSINGALLKNPQFQRNQYGGSIGGPILKDKLFFFVNGERIQQKQSASSGVGTLFQPTIGTQYPTYSSPYKETYETGRIDFNGPKGIHYFVRGNYNFNGSVSNFGHNFQLYTNRDNTYGVAGGADFATGKFTHSIRGSYEKFHNFIGDATAGNASIYNPIPSVTLQYSAQSLFTGPNVDAPQGTFQSDKQFRYDGTYTRGAHIFKFGGSVNRIQSAAFAAFFGLAPRLSESVSTLLSGTVTTQNPSGLGCNGVVGGPACATDPLNGYNLSQVYVGNGLGFSGEVPGFGLAGGGGNAWRAAGYLADSWKVNPNLTITGGVRWSVDTNRENNDLNPPTCGDIAASLSAACAGKDPATSLFALYNPSFTGRTHQPYGNFGPQLGLNFAPGDHKTAFRAGFGIFYESVVFNNTSNAREGLLKAGPFTNYTSTPCSSNTLTFPDGTVVTSVNTAGAVGTGTATVAGGQTLLALCKSNTVAQSAPYFVALQKAYQINTQAHASSTNGAYVGNTLNAAGLYAPNYRTPYSEQWNFGVQRELFKGSVLSADYVHNSTLKISQTLDTNHLGAARNFNLANAQAAITATLAYCNVANVAAAITSCQPTGAAAPRAATIADFASRGLDSQATYDGGNPAAYAGKPNAGAFPGNNPLLGSGAFIQPVGRSGYDALQVVYRAQKSHPIKFVDRGNVQVSYAFSRIVSTAGGGTSDEFFTNAVIDNDNPAAYMGRSALDHSHELNFGGTFVFKYGPQLGLIGHFYSALAGNLALDTGSTSTGQIFQTDVTGDGTTGDPAPGTLPGYYGRQIKGNNLQSFINGFNATQANNLTPAGKAVAASGLITAPQLIALKAAIQPLANLPNSNPAINAPAFRSMDANFSYPIRLNRLREGMSLEPAIAFYNVGNFSNFGVGTNTLTNTTSAGGATNNGSSSFTGANDQATLFNRRILRGTGTFDQGAPRTTEFQLKLNF